MHPIKYCLWKNCGTCGIHKDQPELSQVTQGKGQSEQIPPNTQLWNCGNLWKTCGKPWNGCGKAVELVENTNSTEI